MELDSNHAAFVFAVCADRFYSALAPFAVSDPEGGEPGLGGQLLYAGELDDEGRALVVAANVLGAATLTATADPAAQKRAAREGLADFLVTTLDEALRVLKNQLRKREAVAVCVAARPDAIEREMEERGVQPDLVAFGLSGLARFPACFQGTARHVEHSEAPLDRAVITWSAETAAHAWLPKLDALALDCLAPDAWPSEWAARRWLRLAPRYFGRLAQDRRILSCNLEAAREIFARVQGAVESGDIGAPVWISMSSGAGTQSAHATPPAAPQTVI
jgi:urocanate hydratase